ncbi:MAG: sigma-54-dependent Fis family transcriptional regulator [Gammaproteobacteria bacterium]|nr:sigma-54-dependent Fis family transcriptional regulator [Gammaproteobacteria bacterium]
MTTANVQASVLLIENSPESAALIKDCLHNESFILTHVNRGAAALARIREAAPDAVLLDFDLPDMDGMEVLKYIEQQQLNISIIVIFAQGSANIAEEAIRYGAIDFIEKPFNPDRLVITLRNTLERNRLTRITQVYKEHFEREQYHDFIGASVPMQTIYTVIDNVAGSKASIFILGESGTGKELCAAAIHKESRRKDKAFVPINCAAIPKDLLESEIFGHVKGAFTGAVSDREGAALEADGGTLFLDEIGDMDLHSQSKLLRFIQTGAIQKVGGNKLKEVDVRFISATNHDILADIREGRFREDLYYRLNVIPITLPALRKREKDVLLIAEKFLRIYSREEGKLFVGFAPDTEEFLQSYHWPGNVRELQNVVYNVVVMNQGQYVTPDMLPAPLDGFLTKGKAPPAFSQHTPPPSPKVIRPLWQAEKQLIEEAIEYYNGDVPKAAVMLEINPSTIYRKIRRWKSLELGASA